jgi:maltose O-acetyltransferase
MDPWLFGSVASRLAVRLFRFEPALAGARIEIDGNVRVEGRVWVPGTGRIWIGHGVRLVGRRAPIELRAHPGGAIVIEEGAVLEDGVSIEATDSVRIGRRARIGAFCKIIDNHFHRTTGDRDDRPDAVPVIIAEDVVIGPRAVLLPGAEIGAGATLGPAGVISFHVPARTAFPGPRSARENAA